MAAFSSGWLVSSLDDVRDIGLRPMIDRLASDGFHDKAVMLFRRVRLIFTLREKFI